MSMNQLNKTIGTEISSKKSGFRSYKTQIEESLGEEVSNQEKQMRTKKAKNKSMEKKTPVVEVKSDEAPYTDEEGWIRFSKEERAKVRKSISVPKYDADALDAEAKKLGITISRLVEEMLTDRYYGGKVR